MAGCFCVLRLCHCTCRPYTNEASTEVSNTLQRAPRHHVVFRARVVALAVYGGTTTHLEDLVVVPSGILVVSEWSSDRIGRDRSHRGSLAL